MIGIQAIGWWLPPGRRNAEQIARDYGLSPDALARIGLRSHAVAGEDDHPVNMGARATQNALAAAGLSADKLDLLIYVGVTKDWPPPYVAAFGVLHEMGAKRTVGMDLSTRCTSGIDAMWTAHALIAAGTYTTVAVCCAERFDYLLGPPRAAELAPQACYAAGAATAIISAGADNEIVGYSNILNQDLSIHQAMGPIAGGTRVPVSETAVRDELHVWQTQMTMSQTRQVADYSAAADRYNYPRVMRQAGFDAVDFAVCSPLQVEPQVQVLEELGIDTRKQLFTVQTLGHIGSADLFLILGIAVSLGRDIGTRIVFSNRTPTYSAALAVRAPRGVGGISVGGDGVDVSQWAGL